MRPARVATGGRAAAAAVALALLAGCATVSGPQGPGQKLDPWENWNRKVFAFNEGLDEKVLKPVATAYRDVVPGFVRTAVGNFFANAADGWSAVNLMLQGRFEPALNDTLRFAVNTAFGFGGLVDIMSEAGFEHHYEDFGQTLGRWGVGAGAYIVWPVLGPSSVRESVALPFNRLATPASVIDDGAKAAGITVLELVNTRAELLGASRVIDQIALDKYTFVRDAYLARRRSLVYDGEPPPPDDDDPPDDKGGKEGERESKDGAAASPAVSAPSAPGPAASTPSPSATASAPAAAASAPAEPRR